MPPSALIILQPHPSAFFWIYPVEVSTDHKSTNTKNVLGHTFFSGGYSLPPISGMLTTMYRIYIIVTIGYLIIPSKYTFIILEITSNSLNKNPTLKWYFKCISYSS